MGFAEGMAAIAFFGFLIAVIVVIGGSVQRAIAYKQRKMELESEQKQGHRHSLRDDYIEQLEERVRVLERIATDRGQDLAHQIENLRDRRPEETI